MRQKWQPVKIHQYYLRLEDTYAARHTKIRPPLHVSLNNSVATSSLRETCKGGQFSCVLAA